MSYVALGDAGLGDLVTDIAKPLVKKVMPLLKAEIPGLVQVAVPEIKKQIPGLVQTALPAIQSQIPTLMNGVVPELKKQVPVLFKQVEPQLLAEVNKMVPVVRNVVEKEANAILTGPIVAGIQKKLIVGLALHAFLILAGVYVITKVAK
jgi:hypothetical protein